MAAHIVSWGGNEQTTPSILSLDSIQTSSAVHLAVQERPHLRPRVAESRSKKMGSLLTVPSGGCCTEMSASASIYPRADAAGESFKRHDKYFFKDGNITFLVRGVQP